MDWLGRRDISMTVTVYMEVGTGEVVDLVPWGQVEFSESTGSTTLGVETSHVLVWKKGSRLIQVG